jgi:hypothetical protein
LKPSITERFAPSRFSLALFVLALSVFAWGLQYKLSLYDPPQAPSHTLPSAKLLSKEEQAIPSDSPLMNSTKDESGAMHSLLSAMSIGLLAFCLFLSRELERILAANGTLRAVDRPFCSCVDSSLTAFFFSPPPALS